ncbi:hypothetical protein [Burkholderia gladioli]|uniref:hypothetical protein n=1 Tax=Burkholderia gladioli TaxID=28095 RepID=UPI0034DABBA0
MTTDQNSEGRLAEIQKRHRARLDAKVKKYARQGRSKSRFERVSGKLRLRASGHLARARRYAESRIDFEYFDALLAHSRMK